MGRDDEKKDQQQERGERNAESVKNRSGVHGTEPGRVGFIKKWSDRHSANRNPHSVDYLSFTTMDRMLDLGIIIESM